MKSLFAILVALLCLASVVTAAPRGRRLVEEAEITSSSAVRATVEVNAAGRRRIPRGATRDADDRQLRTNWVMRGSQFLRKICEGGSKRALAQLVPDDEQEDERALGMMKKRRRRSGKGGTGFMMNSPTDVFCRYANIECKNGNTLDELVTGYEKCLKQQLSSSRADRCDECLVDQLQELLDDDTITTCRQYANGVCDILEPCTTCKYCLSVANSVFSCLFKVEEDCFEFVCDSVEPNK